MTLEDFKALHHRCYHGDYGGHVQYNVAAREMVPHLIKVAEMAVQLFNVHQDTKEGQHLRMEMHKAIRGFEGVRKP